MNDTIKKYSIVFNANTKPLEQGLKQTESTLKKFAGIFNGIVATYFSYKMVSGVINGFVDYNKKLQENINLSGASLEYTQALGGALKRFGGSADSAYSALNTLTSKIADAKMGSGALIDVSKKFGLSITDSNGKLLNSENMFKRIVEQMGKYSKEQRIAIAQNLGFDSSIQNALANGGDELNRLIMQQKRFGLSTALDLKLSRNFSFAIEDLKDSFMGVTRILARLILPMLTKLLKVVVSFIEFLKKHKQLVVIFFTAMLVAMTPVLAILLKMALASAAAFAPIYAAVAVISAISLIIEDIYYYFMGWDSVTGDLAKKFPILGTILEGIRPIVMGIVEAFKKIFTFITDPSWNNFKAIFTYIGDCIHKVILAGLEKIKGIASWLGDKLGISIFSDNDSKSAPSAVPAISAGGGNTQNNNVTNNVTQNISSATPKQLADDFNSLAIDSINSQRIQQGVYR